MPTVMEVIYKLLANRIYTFDLVRFPIYAGMSIRKGYGTTTARILQLHRPYSPKSFTRLEL